MVAGEKSLHPISLGVLWREPIPRSLYPIDLGFFGENRFNVEIVVSDWPWCFSARTEQMFVQVFDEFSTSVEVLFNYLVFVLCTPA